MNEQSPLRVADWVLLAAVFIIAAGARAWFLWEYTDRGRADAPWHVQNGSATIERSGEGAQEQTRTALDVLVANLRDENTFRGYAPLGPPGEQEITAHAAPGYAIFRSILERFTPDRLEPLAVVRWVQAVLGSLAAACYFLIARRAFASLPVAALAGLFCALNPFWVINAAELNDGTLASFLLAAGLCLGIRGGQHGGAVTTYAYGLSLAALALVRAALLPVAIVGLLWLLVRSRGLRLGWLYALLAFLGFLTALAPWTVRNFKHFGRFVPIVDSAWWHLWVGNNPQATGGPFEPQWLAHAELGDPSLLAERPQPDRFDALADHCWNEVTQSPGDTIERRFFAGLYFLAGASTVNRSGIVATASDPKSEIHNLKLEEWVTGTLFGFLFGVLVFAVLGLRWSYSLRQLTVPLQLVMFWIPLPYIVSHAESLHGPRLPLDGPLACFAAFAIVWLVTGVRRVMVTEQTSSEI